MSSQELPLARARPEEAQFMHPCEFIERSALQQEEALRMHRIRTTHGLGAATGVALEEMTLLNARRLGALPSSNVLYHSCRGNLTEIGPRDIYGLPENNPNVQPASRAIVERQVYGYELTMKNMGI